jgi:hypothetical protein
VIPRPQGQESMVPSHVSRPALLTRSRRARFTAWVDRLGRGTHLREYLRIHEEALAVTRGVEMARSGPAFERNATRNGKQGQSLPSINRQSFYRKVDGTIACNIRRNSFRWNQVREGLAESART